MLDDEDVGGRLEMAVLGAMLRDNAVIADMVQVLRADDFGKDAHRQVWASVVSLWDRGRPAGLVTLADDLHARGHLANVGGYAFLARLWEESATAARAVYHAERVRENSILRRLELAGQQVAHDAAHPDGPAVQVLERAERLVLEIADVGVAGGAVPLAEVMHEATDHLDAISRRNRHLSGVPTGFTDLDEQTAGLQQGELVVLAARPSVGKTALGLAIAANVAAPDAAPVFFASLEQSRIELALRLLCSRGRVDSHRLRRGLLTTADADALRDAASGLRRSPLHIDDSAAQNVLRIGANARRLKRKHGLALVVVDYLQLVEPENRKEPRQEQVAGISRRLKHLARELRVPVLALAQLNRGVEDRAGQRPRLADLRESGAIEADADVVLLLHRLADGPSGPAVEVIIAKQRNGPIGEVTLTYRPPFMLFEDFAVGSPFENSIPD